MNGMQNNIYWGGKLCKKDVGSVIVMIYLLKYKDKEEACIVEIVGNGKDG